MADKVGVKNNRLALICIASLTAMAITAILTDPPRDSAKTHARHAVKAVRPQTDSWVPTDPSDMPPAIAVRR